MTPEPENQTQEDSGDADRALTEEEAAFAAEAKAADGTTNPPPDGVLAKIMENLDTLAGAVSRFAEVQGEQEKTQQEQQKRLSEVQAIAENASQVAEAIPVVEEDLPPGPVSLPEGTVRFFSQFKDYTIILEPATVEHVGNRRIPIPGRTINFSGGIYQTDNAETIEELRSLPAFNREFFEGLDEVNFPGPNIVDGPRSSGIRERPAELAARLN